MTTVELPKVGEIWQPDYDTSARFIVGRNGNRIQVLVVGSDCRAIIVDYDLVVDDFLLASWAKVELEE